MITAAGILQRTVQIGNEMTGWSLVLDQESEFSLCVSEVEIDPGDNDIGRLDGRSVRVTGDFVQINGIERGLYEVFLVKTVEEM